MWLERLNFPLVRTGIYDSHPEIAYEVHRYAVYPESSLRHGVWPLVICTDLRDFEFGADELALRQNLTAKLPGDRTGQHDGLESWQRDAFAHLAFDHEELEKLQHALDPEGARLNGVLEEVCFENVVVGVVVPLSAQPAKTLCAACPLEC